MTKRGLLHAELSSRTSSLTVCAVAQYSFCSTRQAQFESLQFPHCLAVAQYSFCSTRQASVRKPSASSLSGCRTILLLLHSPGLSSKAFGFLTVWLSPDKKIKPYTLLKVNFHRVMAHFFAWLVANTQIYTPCPIWS